MGRKRNPEPRVLGPYLEASRNRWRVLTVRADGSRTSPRYFAAEAEAKRHATRLAQALGQRMAGPAVEAWLEHRRKVCDGAPVTLRNIAYRLAHLIEPTVPLAMVGQAYLEKRSLALLAGNVMARASLASALGNARTWLRWCADQGWIRPPELRPIRLPGRPKRGKKQLTEDEAGKLWSAILADPDPLALAVGTALTMGLRSGEILDRKVRDLDASGTSLRVLDGTKTDSSQRVLTVPMALRGRLLALAAGKAPEAPLMPTSKRARLRSALSRLCKAARVPVVCPHGLRGTWATLAWGRSDLPEVVARSLGHASTTMTKDHYLAPGADQDASTKAVVSKLGSSFTDTVNPKSN
jgi:integrase